MSPRLQLVVTAVLALGAGLAAAQLLGGFFGATESTAGVSSASQKFESPDTLDPAQLSPVDRPAAAIPSSASEQEMARHLAEVVTRIRREYVDELSTEEWLDRTLRSLMSSLDGHSAYLDAGEHEAVLRNVAGHYPGVGIEVAASNDRILILRTLDNSPASRAGLRVGDEIITIDNLPVAADAAAAIAQMRGPQGTRVGLTVRRAQGGELVELALERTQVDVKSVTYAELGSEIGYLRIHSFSETTPADFIEAVTSMKSALPALSGVVLDLRNNPGGVLESATTIADALLDDGVIVSAQGRAADSVFQMTAAPGDVLQGIALIVLINEGSASSAEILAGALQDHGRAKLLGRRSYGKGSVQSVIPLAEGRALKLTTSRYVTPSGRSIHTDGIRPDVLVEAAESIADSPQLDPVVQAAIGELRRLALSKRTRTADTRRPAG